MLHIGICDDSKEVCAELEDILWEYAQKKKIQMDVLVWYTGEGLCRYLKDQEHFLDILFLDIELISTDGIKVGKYIREELDNLETDIVYISGKSSYAMELFQVQPLDFLVKPLDKNKIHRVIECKMRLEEKRKGIFEYFVSGYYFKVKYREILYFSSQNKKIRLVLQNEQKEFNGKLKEVAKKVPESFIQIHQSYIINFDHISECTYESVRMCNGEVLPISQSYRKLVRAQIAKRIWRNRR